LYSLDMNPGLDVLSNTVKHAQVTKIISLTSCIRTPPWHVYHWWAEWLTGEAYALTGQDVSNRIWAGKELAKLGTRPALRALREALKVEPFWGVRVQLAKALANQKNAGIFVSEILAEVITSESDARAFMPILDSCSSIRYVCAHACTSTLAILS
jgi:hypothetical protein